MYVCVWMYILYVHVHVRYLLFHRSLYTLVLWISIFLFGYALWMLFLLMKFGKWETFWSSYGCARQIMDWNTELHMGLSNFVTCHFDSWRELKDPAQFIWDDPLWLRDMLWSMSQWCHAENRNPCYIDLDWVRSTPYVEHQWYATAYQEMILFACHLVELG